MPHRTPYNLVIALSLAVTIGCESKLSEPRGGGDGGLLNLTGDGAPTTGPDLMPQAEPPIEDLPVPIGFVLIESISRHYVLPSGRLVDHTYQGRDANVDVDRFYATQMPDAGWTLKDRRMMRGSYTLNFTKAAERCEVRITAVGGLTGKRSNVAIHVQPSSPADTTTQPN